MPGPNEAQTRKQYIDKALAHAGWDVANENQVGIEVPVDEADIRQANILRERREAGEDVELSPGFADYVLYRDTGEVLAVVEAKRLHEGTRKAEAQAAYYVEEISKWPSQTFRPFAFMTDGEQIRFWQIGEANSREVSGFFTPIDLENRLYLRQNRLPLSTAVINESITNRLYQINAIRAVAERFEQLQQRRALLVMATGTGKTRVAMSLIDIFLRTNQVRRVLFVADRDNLTDQAQRAFVKHLSDEPSVRIHSGRVQKQKESHRLFTVTLQTLSNVFRQFSPGFFDLIVFDEAHRSIFNKFGEILTYFDARMIGLTATPASFIDRNTFLLFDHADEKPTFLYTFEEAVDEEYLVDFYEPYQAQTSFQKLGIKWHQLTEEQQNQLMQEGRDPDSINWEGTDLEKKVSNKDTIRKQWDEILRVAHPDQSGQMIGKTIVFAMSQKHANNLLDVFEKEYPQWPGLAKVITHETEYKGKLTRPFIEKELPRIAISVDMLDTGVDVPAVTNLVFMKPVHSFIKLWQMIGRGTRHHDVVEEDQHHLLPNGRKTDFRIIDFWQNDFQRNPSDAEPPVTTPVLVTIFNTRLKLLAAYQEQGEDQEARLVIQDLREQISQIPLDSFSVKRLLPAEMKIAWEDEYWRFITQTKLDELQQHVGPLLRFAPGTDVQAATFTSKMERLKLQLASGTDASHTVQSIREDADRLRDNVLNQRERDVRDFVLSGNFTRATVAELNQVIEVLAGQMRKRRKLVKDPVLLDLVDEIAVASYVYTYDDRGRPVYEQAYKEMIEARIEKLIDHPVIAAIENGAHVTDAQLIDFERAMRRELGEIELTEEKIKRAYNYNVDSFIVFMRYMFDLDGIPDYGEIVTRQFDEFGRLQNFNAIQTTFLRTIRNQFIKRRRLQMADLYDPPFTRLLQDPEQIFTAEQLFSINELTTQLSIL